MSLEVRRAGSRFVSVEAGRETRHSFSFGPHYDAGNLGFGLLVSHNDDLLAPGAGYPDHPHQEIEVVTWVLSGALAHRDSTGSSGVLLPGQVQVMSAGTGVVHSELAAPGAGSTRFVQTWVRPAAWGEPPSYASATVAPGSGWTAVVGGGGLPVRAGATLWISDAGAGDELRLPDVAHAHLFVATGAARLGDIALTEGDAARMTDRGGDLTVTAPGQLMLWTFDA
jgi:redox-sensitive bicupin YhaK (pirin superfamily)